MAKKSKFGANPGTGISSILMIFVVLCITTFGVLSFVSARADLRLTQVNEQTAQTYYAAGVKAQQTLAQLDALLQKVQQLPKDATAQQSAAVLGLSESAAQEAAARLAGVSGKEERYAVLAAYAAASLQENAAPGSGQQAEYLFALSDTHELRVTVKIDAPGQTTRCRIVSEQIEETGSGEDRPLNVWPGN